MQEAQVNCSQCRNMESAYKGMCDPEKHLVLNSGGVLRDVWVYRDPF